MKREELTAAGLTDEQIEKVMKMNGDDINREKAKFADYEETKAQLEKANATLEGMKDYDAVKADVLKYQQEAEKAKADAAERVQQLEDKNRVKDFTSGKKFVNELTRDAINAQLYDAMNAAANKGKSLDDLLKEITDGKENIFVTENAPTPPTIPDMHSKGNSESGVFAAFKNLNPNLKID